MLPSERREKWKTARSWIENRRCYVAAEVIEIGQPMIIKGVGTAYVAVVDDRLVFGFDVDWFEKLDVDELVGVLCHEAMHVVLRHVFVTGIFLRRAERHLFNLACDAVINDLIAHYYPEVRLPGEPITGVGLIGRSTIGMTAERVYDILRRKTKRRGESQRLATLDDHGFWDDCGIVDAAGRHHRKGLYEKLAAALDRCVRVDSWGKQALGSLRNVAENEPQFDLERLLLQRIGSLSKHRTQWVPPSRRLVAFYPKVILPTYSYRNIRRVLLALDASGSVPNHALGVFISLAKRRYDDCLVEAISFDVAAYRFDPNEPKAAPRGGGGTDFNSVEKHAVTLPWYPDLVVVLTDGRAPRPTIGKPNRWLWCVTKGFAFDHLMGIGEVVELPATGAKWGV